MKTINTILIVILALIISESAFQIVEKGLSGFLYTNIKLVFFAMVIMTYFLAFVLSKDMGNES